MLLYILVQGMAAALWSCGATCTVSTEQHQCTMLGSTNHVAQQVPMMLQSLEEGTTLSQRVNMAWLSVTGHSRQGEQQHLQGRCISSSAAAGRPQHANG